MCARRENPSARPASSGTCANFGKKRKPEARPASAKNVQRASLARIERREIGHVLRVEAADLSAHDRVLARSRLVVAQRLQQVVVVLPGEARKIRTRGAVSVRPVAGGAGLRLQLSGLRIARGEGLRAGAREHEDKERLHLSALPAPPQYAASSAMSWSERYFA